MSQHDFNIANQSGANFRSDLNNALGALVSNFSGNTAPTTTLPFMFWVDTSGAYPVLNVRNAADTAWIIIGRLDLESLGLKFLEASNAGPTSPQPYQYWVDTNGAYPILKIRNAANSAWLTVGRLDVNNYGLMPLTGGTFSGFIDFSNTDYIKIPKGTTAQRPGSPGDGMIRFNTDLNVFEGYKSGSWGELGGGGFVVTAVQTVSSGGTVTTSTSDQRQQRLVVGNGAPTSASTTPFGTGGGWKNGTEIQLIGTDDSQSVILAFSDVAKGLVGNFSEIELTKYKTVLCVYNSALDRWIVQQGLA
jgi:hypothetical protein